MAGSRYDVVVSPAAQRVLSKIKDRVVLKRLVAAMAALETTPRPSGMKALQGTESLFRIRVGDYRIVYTITDRVLTVEVVMVGHRRDVYQFLTRR